MAALDPVKYIWMDGELVEWEKATVHVLTHSLHYGSGVFEGIRCYETPEGPAVFRLRDHMERLARSAKMIMMELPYSVDETCEAVCDTLRANELKECYIRPIFFRGYGFMGLNPIDAPVNFTIAAWEWPAYLGEEANKNGTSIGISSWRQRSANSCPPAVKGTGNYMNSSLANIEAVRHGYDEALLLNEEGKVAEGPGENIFMVRDGVLSTPPLSDGILEGITRDSILQFAVDSDIPVSEESLVRTDLYAADEVFMAGSAAEIAPVSSIDGRFISKPGEITRFMQEKFANCVHGKLPEYESWLTRL